MKMLQFWRAARLVAIGLMVGNFLAYASPLAAQVHSEPTAAAEKKKSKNEDMTAKAWESYNVGQFSDAIRYAKECISEFRREAMDRQKELTDAKEPSPPVGNVTDEALKNQILGRGPLNDVAACYFIMGEANLKLSRRTDDEQERKHYRTEAKKAYEACAMLTYARLFDPTPPTWFWNAAKKANERLEDEFPPNR